MNYLILAILIAIVSSIIGVTVFLWKTNRLTKKKLAAIVISAGMIITSAPIILGPLGDPVVDTYYVSTTGSDSSTNGSISHPFLTLKKAINFAANSDIIIMRGGNYQDPGWNGDGVIRINKSGQAGFPFTIKNYTGEKVVIDGQTETITAGAYGAFMPYSSYGGTYYRNITIQGLNFSNISTNAIYLNAFYDGSNLNDMNENISILNCDFYNVTYRAVYCYNSFAPTRYIQNIRVANCTFNYCQTNGSTGEVISFGGTYNYTLEYSYLAEFVKQGVAAGAWNAKYGYIHDNVLYSRYYFAIKIDPNQLSGAGKSADHIYIYNNMIYGEGQSATSVPGAIAVQPEESNDYIHNVSIYNNVINLTASTSHYHYGIVVSSSASKTGIRIENITIDYNTVDCAVGTSYCMKLNNRTGSYAAKWKDIVVKNNIFLTHGANIAQVYCDYFRTTQTNVSFGHNMYYNVGNSVVGIRLVDDSSYLYTSNGEVEDNPEVVAYDSDYSLNSTSPAIDYASTPYVSYDKDYNSRPQGSSYDIGAYEYVSVSAYNAKIRNNGVDYFVWLGSNVSAYAVVSSISGFNEDDEYISIWNSSTWNGHGDGGWTRYYGDHTGVNFTVHTFDVIKIYLDDSGTQTIYMTENPNINYNRQRTVSVQNLTKNKGYNYTGYTSLMDNTLGGMNGTNITLSAGSHIAVWDNSTYTWVAYIAYFGMNANQAVSRWDVIETKVQQTRSLVI